jgi:multisubunit Na+/H+ antiporter MnhE subunit
MPRYGIKIASRCRLMTTRSRIVGWLAWFAVLNVLWLVFIAAWVPEEEVLGLVASAIAATAAQAVREQGLARFRMRARWLWHARVLPWRAVSESGLVLFILARHLMRKGPVRGRFRVVPVTLPKDPREQAAKRALLTAGESFAPNGYVLTIDTRKKVMLVHELELGDEP